MPRPRTKKLSAAADSSAPAAPSTATDQQIASAPAEMVDAPVQVEVERAEQDEAPAPDARRLAAMVEALLLSTDKPIPGAKLAAVLGLIDEEAQTAPAEATEKVVAAIADLNGEYDRSSRSFRVELVAGGYRVMTRPEFAEVIARLHRSRVDGKLSRPALETLAIIAYRQPITRADLEAIRGVACGEVLRSLLERRLVAITGRAEELGRPMLYGTTRQFLESFGLASLKDLPTLTELKAP